MKIGIIGGGAVGLLFGAYFGTEYDVTIYTRSSKQAEKINEQGLQLSKQGNFSNIPLKANANFAKMEAQNLIIVAVKQYDLESLLPILKKISANIPLLFIQNGMGHLQKIDQLADFTTIYIGTVEHGVQRLTERSIIHTGIGKTNIGIFRGGIDQLTLFPHVADKHFPVYMQADSIDMLQRKLIANALINPLTAVFNVKNGHLLNNPFYYRVFTKLYTEISILFPELHKSGIMNEVESICASTKDNTSSMLKDIKEGRKTEIDAILGYIIEQGGMKGHSMPLSNMVYNMIKGMEIEGSSRGLC
ncbi:2-dehydropantoate 2-reductase [Pseudogracilibacillus auburnensis]|uniref:2-dehydropantoate 2-reductase n=1 Tax=Pseudogracilibacillus auburnensis TaxID=1494959 RepID=UPI001A95740A|nr:2-dehydropantoate 2-reductase [Pseudogracilibacillus auburnensis]MBO1004924.1 2-dehydropantoate 2-reductase [Pseudogracilibacillus auburnensis]